MIINIYLLMDILEQYNQENPEQKQAPQGMYDDQSQDYGSIISFVLRVSRGRIQNERQANFILLIVTGIITVAAIIIFISGIAGDGGTPLPYEQTYKPVQSNF